MTRLLKRQADPRDTDQRRTDQRQADQRPGVRPRISPGRRLDAAARASFPVCITIVLMLLAQAPLGIPGQAVLLPAIVLCCVWFWTQVRPDALPPPAVFMIGLLLDLLGYLPLGVGVFTLLAVQAIALAMRQVLSHSGFVSVWLVFAAASAGASLLIWLLVMLLTFRLLSPHSAIFLAVLTVAVFPVLAVPFIAAHHSVADPDRA